MNENYGKVMAAVLEWAYKNKIEVRFIPAHRVYGFRDQDSFIIRFSKNNNQVEHTFLDFDNMENYMKHVCKKVAIDLCVHPLVIR